MVDRKTAVAKIRLAKLNMPRSPRAVPRPRVTGAIEQRRGSAVLWVSGPPGSGKTTAISLYVESRSAFSLWYRLDPLDSDPATFLHFFGELVRARRPKATAALPALGPEHLADLAAFSRRYFRAVIGLLPSDAILVFDEYDAIGDASESHLVFATLVDEVPEDLQVAFISRARPPRRFARSAMCGRIAWLD